MGDSTNEAIHYRPPKNDNIVFISPDESKSWNGQRSSPSPASSVTSGISNKSLPARLPNMSNDERKRLNDEAFAAWKQNKVKQEAEKRAKAKEEQEKTEQQKKEKAAQIKQQEVENRANWLKKKQTQAEAGKQKKLEALRKKKQEKDEKQRFSNEMVSKWMSTARHRSKPLNGNIFESPCVKFVNPIPWNGVLDD